MRVVALPTPHDRRAFDYFCPVCGVELAEFSYETVETAYSCPGCGTRQRASKIPARPR
jgi:hypothetical protein